jgi:hypothetical protein
MAAIPKNSPESINLEDLENRKKLVKMIMRLFEHWELDTASQLNLLGLSPTSRALLSKYRSGEQALATRDALDRIGWLLSIHKALRLLYPHNENIRYSWVNRRNQVFDNLSPLEIMKEQGIIGLAKIARYLDHLRGQ